MRIHIHIDVDGDRDTDMDMDACTHTHTHTNTHTHITSWLTETHSSLVKAARTSRSRISWTAAVVFPTPPMP